MKKLKKTVAALAIFAGLYAYSCRNYYWIYNY